MGCLKIRGRELGGRNVGAGGVGAAVDRIGRNPVTIIAPQGFTVFAGEEILGFQAHLGTSLSSTFGVRSACQHQTDSGSKVQQLFVRRPALLIGRSLGVRPEAAAGANIAECGEDGVVRVDLFTLQDVLVAIAVGDFNPHRRIVAEEVHGCGIALFGLSSRSAGALGPSGRFRFVVRVFSHNFSLL